MVRMEPVGLGFFMFVACSLVSLFPSVWPAIFGRGTLADRSPGRRGPSARHKLLADRPRTGRELFIIRGALLECRLPFSDFPLFEVCYWRVGFLFRTVRPGPMDRPPVPRGLSAWCLEELLSPLLLDSCFRFGVGCGLLLGLVGP
jgi:hypothetical protein